MVAAVLADEIYINTSGGMTLPAGLDTYVCTIIILVCKLPMYAVHEEATTWHSLVSLLTR